MVVHNIGFGCSAGYWKVLVDSGVDCDDTAFGFGFDFGGGIAAAVVGVVDRKVLIGTAVIDAAASVVDNFDTVVPVADVKDLDDRDYCTDYAAAADKVARWPDNLAVAQLDKKSRISKLIITL